MEYWVHDHSLTVEDWRSIGYAIANALYLPPSWLHAWRVYRPKEKGDDSVLVVALWRSHDAS